MSDEKLAEHYDELAMHWRVITRRCIDVSFSHWTAAKEYHDIAARASLRASRYARLAALARQVDRQEDAA